MPISPLQVNLLLARLTANGLRSDQHKMDWLYEHDVNVNDLNQLESSLSHARLQKLLEELE